MDTIPADSLFLTIESASNEGAFGVNSLPEPTDAQKKLGNYKMGRFTLYGLPIAIEQPRNSYRTGVSDSGKRWVSRMAAHYGYVAGTKGADGDAVDVFVGYYPQSEMVYVVNQYWGDKFDEHKVMLAFPDEESARNAYLGSYDKGWQGLKSLVPCSISQFKWWLKNSDLSRPLSADQLPYEGLEDMNRKLQWDDNAAPVGVSLDHVLYDVRRNDADGLLLDSVTVAEIMDDADSVMALDALVVPFQRLERQMNIIRSVMERAGQTVKPSALQITEPFKQRGTANVAAVFELSDGQTVSVFFHNPDVTPTRIAPTDELVSWKWMLNKKDITIVVAPERGSDLNIREVARRIMKLAEKNSAAFTRANARRADRMQSIEGLKAEITQLETELSQAQRDLEVARIEAESRPVPAPEPAPAVVEPPVVPEIPAEAVIDWMKAEQIETQAELQALGAARINDVGAENVYIDKNGKPYFFKPGNASKYEIGEHDFSNDQTFAPHEATPAPAVDPVNEAPAEAAAPAPSSADAITLELPDSVAADSALAKGVDTVKQLRAQLEEKGIEHPTPEQFMEDVENGNRRGNSLPSLQASLISYQNDLAGVNGGTVSAVKIVGRGRGGKSAAIEWLTARIADTAIAVQAGGFLEAINVNNYAYALRSILNSGADAGFESDEARTQREQAEAEARDQSRIDDEKLQADFELARNYQEGSEDGLSQPFDLSFTVPVGHRKFVVALKNAGSNQERYEMLASGLTNGIGVKQQDSSFSNKVDVNSAMKKGVGFSYFSMAPRAGYTLVKLVIDLNGKPAVETPDAEEIKGAKVASVNAAYLFDDATDEFKAWVGESVGEEFNSPFLSARVIDETAKRSGASVQWGSFGGLSLDDVSHAVAQLETALEVVETNLPINVAEGNLEQAKLEAEAAESIGEAIEILANAEDGEKKGDAPEAEPVVPDAAVVLDGVDEDGYVGKIKSRNGDVIGRVAIVHGGKAMVFLGASGDARPLMPDGLNPPYTADTQTLSMLVEQALDWQAPAGSADAGESVEVIEPTVEPVEAPQDANAEARAFLQSIIDGQADVMDAGIPARLEQIKTEHGGEVEMAAQWDEAARAYISGITKAATAKLTGE